MKLISGNNGILFTTIQGKRNLNITDSLLCSKFLYRDIRVEFNLIIEPLIDRLQYGQYR